MNVLSPRELAEAIGVSESSLKRWADDGLVRVARTAGGHRRIALAEAIRFIRESRLPVLRPDLLGLPDVRALQAEAPSGESAADRFHTFLVEGRAAQARGLILSLYLGGESIAAIADGPIRGAMARLGELWHTHPEGLFLEHRATDICIAAVWQLHAMLSVTSGSPTAVGGAPPEDRYVLPSLLAATVLAAGGFEAVNLGPHTPLDTLLTAARHHRARLVWVSVTHVVNPNALAQDLGRLSAELQSSGTSLAVGGAEYRQVHAELRGDVLAGATMAELAAYAKGLLRSTALGAAGPEPALVGKPVS